jgi:hypothetical protein
MSNYPESIPATPLFRSKVAAAVASGTPAPRIVEIAYGRSGDATEEPTLIDEWNRFLLDEVVADGVVLMAAHTLTGEMAAGEVTREVALIDDAGDVAGRRVVAPKGLDSFSRLDWTFKLIF